MIPTAHVITLLDSLATPRWTATAAHLTERGMDHRPFTGINGTRWGLDTTLCYEEDAPGSGYKIGPKTIGIALSHYMLWQALSYFAPINASPLDSYLICEDDLRLAVDWRPRLEAALTSLPADWDMLYVGSCCTDGRVGTDYGAGVFACTGPQCLHCYMVRRKALPYMLETQQMAWAGIDITLVLKAHPRMQIFAILPRLAEQHDTFLHP